ncbi:MAG: hypothetical protein ABH816_04270 [Candidatus Levyibacteriota bacterium]
MIAEKEKKYNPKLILRRLAAIPCPANIGAEKKRIKEMQVSFILLTISF